MPGARVASGRRVALRTIECEDVDFLQRGYANPEIRYPIGNPIRNREAVEPPDSEEPGDSFLVCQDNEDAGPGSSDDGDVRRLGTVTVDDVDYRRPELAYWLAPEVHGQGYGSEAVSLAIDHVFRSYDHPAVGAQAYAFNDASRGLLSSLGFEEEGRIRKDRFIDGRYVDTVLYGLLREDWLDRD